MTKRILLAATLMGGLVALWCWTGALRGGRGAAARRLDARDDSTAVERGDGEALVDPGTARATPEEGRGVALRAALRSSAAEEADEADDVPSATLPLLVGGKARDDEGRLVRGARVQYYLDPVPGQQSPGVEVTDGLFLTDSLGHFELRSRAPASVVGVQITRDDFVAEAPVLAPAGTDGLVVVLRRGGRIAGRLAAANPLFWPEFEILRGTEVVSIGVSLKGSGEFDCGPLLPGTYELVCGYSWSHQRFRVGGIVVVAGQVTRDPRLELLDLGTLFTPRVLTIVDRAGKAILDATVFLPRKDSGEWLNVWAAHRGEQYFLAAGSEPVNVRIEAPGFRPLELEGVEFDRRVVLEAGIRVRLGILGRLPELPAAWELRVELTRLLTETGEPVRHRARSPDFGLASAALELALGEPGSYGVSFLVRGRASGYFRECSFWDEPPCVLEVRGDGKLQAFEVRAPSAATADEMLAFIAEHPF